MGVGQRFKPGCFRGAQVAVVGMGKSNQALTRYLVKEGAEVTCFDRKTAGEIGPAYAELSALGVKWSLGSGYLSALPSFRWVFLTPGMKKNLPEIAAARERGAVITGEIGLLLDRLRCPVVAVTGSAGKTTTCTLAGLMLRESFPEREVHVGGNIGSVLIEHVQDIPEDAVVVLELSSFQLELLTRSPRVSAVLNLKPNHLDVHESYDDYVEAKKNIFRFQGASDWCFLNLDDDVTSGFATECPGGLGFFTLDPGKIVAGAGGEPGGRPAAWADGGDLYVAPGPLADLPSAACWKKGGRYRRVARRGDLLVPGDHNVLNALAAALLAVSVGATPEGIGRAIETFRGVEHRIEFVRELKGVKYYNDSIATAPDRTEALLDAIQGPLVLILGGYDKGLTFNTLARKIVKRGCGVVTMGATAPLIEEALARAKRDLYGDAAELALPVMDPLESVTQRSERGAPGLRTARASSLDEAVTIATAMARSLPGSSVALSPACASYDMFQNYEERGRLFKEAVGRLS
jgi:UDP-N-acetylmuramoylalanine--D-glutamate ligase